eukprot:447290_1
MMKCNIVPQFGIVNAPNIGCYTTDGSLPIAQLLVVIKLPDNALNILNMTKSTKQRINYHINKLVTDRQHFQQMIDQNQISSTTKLPTHLNADIIMKTWEHTYHFELQSLDNFTKQTDIEFNLFYQGWLFNNILQNDMNIKGYSLYPLIGIFDCIGIQQMQSTQTDIGYETFNYSDQHCHFDIVIDNFGEWNIGSNKSKFAIDRNNHSFSKFWSVCIDYENKRMDISLIYIIHNDTNIINECKTIISQYNPYESLQRFKLFFDKLIQYFNDMENIETFEWYNDYSKKIVCGYLRQYVNIYAAIPDDILKLICQTANLPLSV